MTSEIEDIKGKVDELIDRDNFHEDQYLKEKAKERKVNMLHMGIGIGFIVLLLLLLAVTMGYTIGYNAGYDAAIQYILSKTLLAKFGVAI